MPTLVVVLLFLLLLLFMLPGIIIIIIFVCIMQKTKGQRTINMPTDGRTDERTDRHVVWNNNIKGSLEYLKAYGLCTAGHKWQGRSLEPENNWKIIHLCAWPFCLASIGTGRSKHTHTNSSLLMKFHFYFIFFSPWATKTHSTGRG